jgi:two-component system chemotaxis response regulator CheY
MRVLIADDSRVMRKLILKSLKDNGFSVDFCVEAENGEDAWTKIQANPIDLAILDIHMPFLNGEALLTRVRADPAHRDLPIVIVSSESSAARLESLLDQRAGFVHKPWSDEDFHAQVRLALDRRRGPR